MLRELFILTITNPSEAAQRILGLRLTPWVCLLALAVSLILAVLVSSGLSLAVGSVSESQTVVMDGYTVTIANLGPWGSLAVSATVAMVMAALVWLVGYAFGGSGALFQILALLAWAEAFNLALNLFVILLSLVVPVLGQLAVLAMVALIVRMFVYFVQQAHGFSGVGKAVAVFICAILLGIFVLANMAAVTGFITVELHS